MAAKTRIKHLTSSGVLAPTILKTGEIGYSYGTGTQSNYGDRLFIGIGAEDSNGIATEIVQIGGQYYTDLLDHAHGTLTASSAIITDSSNKINQLNVDNLRLDLNTLSSTNTNGDIIVDPDGTGKLVLHNVYINGTTDTLAEFIYDTVGGAVTGGTGITVTNDDAGNTSTVSITDTTVSAGSYGSATQIPTFTVNAQGQLTAAGTASVATQLTVDGDTGSQNVDLLTEDLQILGTTNEIVTAVTQVGSDVKVTLALPDDVTIGNDLNITNDLKVATDKFTVDGGTGNTVVDGTLQVNGNVNLGNATSDNVVIAGNLTVQGTTTTVESTTITLDDPVIALADNTTSNTSDGLDRGVRFKWGTGSAVATGFFGFDIQTERFVFTKDEDFSVEENASSPWSDAEFGNVYGTGAQFGNVQVGLADNNTVRSLTGKLILDSSSGEVEINDNLDLNGNLDVSGVVTFANALTVSNGGTGRATITNNAVMVGNGTSPVTQLTGSQYEILQAGASGVPEFSNIIDGGTY